MRKAVLGFLCLYLLLPLPAYAQAVGECVRLQATHVSGVPAHASAGQRAVSERLAHGTVHEVIAIDATTGWFNVGDAGDPEWIISRYIDGVVACDGGAPAPVPAGLAYRVGTWNLEHFYDGAARGFPEDLGIGPSYPNRTDDDYEAIADVIATLDVKILLL